MSGIEAVVFDVGNVLFHWNPRHLYERLIEDGDRLDWFLANVVTLDWHFQLDAGRSFAECAEELAAWASSLSTMRTRRFRGPPLVRCIIAPPIQTKRGRL